MISAFGSLTPGLEKATSRYERFCRAQKAKLKILKLTLSTDVLTK